MKIVKHFILFSALLVTFSCFGIPLIIHAPIFEKEIPASKAPASNARPEEAGKKLFTGPTQPELQSFKSADASGLVDLVRTQTCIVYIK